MNGLTYHLPTTLEKNAIKVQPQATKLGLAWWNPNIKFQCRTTGTFSTTDRVTEFAYTSAIGDWADALPEFTAWISAVGYGYAELGQCRVRSADAAKIYVGMTSEIAWASGLYVTIVDVVSIWRKPIVYEDDGTILVDGIIEYTNQHTNPYPIINCGSVRVLKREIGYGVAFELDASDSTIASGSIASWSTSKISGVLANLSLADQTTDCPTASITADGQYLLRIRATSDAGKVSNRYVYVWVYSDTNPLISGVTLPQPVRGQYGAGFSASVEFVGDASGLAKYAPAALVARDFYGGVEGSKGPYTNYSNVLHFGWVANDVIRQDVVGGSVKIKIEGPEYWLRQAHAVEIAYKFVSGTPAAWDEIKNQTTASALKFFLQEHTNINAVCDVYVQNDGLYAPEIKAASGNLWAQITAIAGKNLMTPTCDQWGRLIIEKNANQLPIADRSAIPQVMSLTKDDFESPLEFGRQLVATAAAVDLIGINTNAGGVTTTYPALAPGLAGKNHGQPISMDGILVASQANANEIAGAILGNANNPYPSIPVTMLYNNRFFSIAPQMYATITLDAVDNLRGVGYDGHAIPRAIEYSHDPETDTLTVSIDWEGYAGAEIATVGTNPEEPNDPDPPNPRIPSDPEPPDPEPPLGEIPVRAIVLLTSTGLYFVAGDETSGINSVYPTWYPLHGACAALDGFSGGNFIKEIACARYESIIYARTTDYMFYCYLDPAAVDNYGLIWWVTNTWLTEQATDTDAVYTSVGTNPLTGDVIIVAGSDSAFNKRKYVFSAFAASEPTKTMATDLWIMDSGDVVLGDGKIYIWGATVYGATGIFFSDDGGATFQTPTHDSTLPPLNVRSNLQVGASQIFYAPFSAELSRSEDGGLTWTKTFDFTAPPNYCIAVSPDDVLLRMDITDHGMFTSSDGGVSWTKLWDTADATPLATFDGYWPKQLFGLGAGVWCAVSIRGFFFSVDGGATWTQRNGNLLTLAGDGSGITLDTAQLEAIL